jgi:hypothetical protein
MEKIASSKNFEREPSKEMLLPLFTSLWNQPGSNFTKLSPNSLAGKRGFWGRKLSKTRASRKFTTSTPQFFRG